MELVKKSEPLEFKHEDVIFLVKAVASDGDRMDVKLAGKWDRTSYVFSPPEFNRALVRRMVIGWKNVTVEGKEVPYSFELLDNYFPITGKESIFALLGNFIEEKTGIFKKDEIRKNASRGQQTGPSK